MTSADKQDQECKDGVCEVNFKPIQAARRTFQNLTALAHDLMGKVKDSFAVDNNDETKSDSSKESDEKNQTNKVQRDTVKESTLDNEGETAQLSNHSSVILNNFVQNSWRPLEFSGDQTDTGEHLRMVHVRPRAPEGLREAPRYSNPWRYDAHH